MNRLLDRQKFTHIEGYRPDIDGIRALAVLPVIFFHYGVAGFSGGYLGVDVFFVISGYLITGILLRDCDRPGSVLLRFWERRARRILPALFFMLAVITALAVVLYLPLELRRYGQELLSQAVFSSNILFFIKSGDYFHPVAETRTLLHTWSLSVEEQFYVLYPLMFLGFLKFGKRRLLFALLAFTAGSFLLSAATVSAYQQANFYLLPFRAWELGLGCCLALVSVPKQPGWVTELLAGLGLAMILGALTLFDSKTPFPGSAALLPCIGTALLLAFGDKSNWTGALLKIPAMVGVGRISYSLYLWHWPLLVLLATVTVAVPGPGDKAIALVATLVLAWISWRYVETPFRVRKVMVTRIPLVAYSAGCLTMLFATGWVFHLSKGLPQRWDELVVQYEAGERDRNPRRGKCRDLASDAIARGDVCKLGVREKTSDEIVFVWGDSHGDAIMPVLEALADQKGVAGLQVTRVACLPIVTNKYRQRSGCDEFVTETKGLLARKPDLENIVLVFRWSNYKGNSGEYVDGLRETIEAIRNNNRRIWFVRQVPEHHFPVPRKVARATGKGEQPADFGLDYGEYLEQRTIEDAILVELEDIIDYTIDPADLLCQDHLTCINASHGHALYFDEHHLTAAGSMELLDLFELQLFDRIIESESLTGK